MELRGYVTHIRLYITKMALMTLWNNIISYFYKWNEYFYVKFKKKKIFFELNKNRTQHWKKSSYFEGAPKNSRSELCKKWM